MRRLASLECRTGRDGISGTLGDERATSRPDPNPFPSGRLHYAFSLLPRGLERPHVLDYGCWDGTLVHEVRRVVNDSVAWGCDLDADAIAQAAARHGDEITFFVVDPAAEPLLPLADNSMSVVFLCDVLEHLGEGIDGRVLDELTRVVAPGGSVIVTVPHHGALAWADPENFKFRWPAVHRHAYTWLHGPETFVRHYGEGNERVGNYSPGARWHRHYSLSELQSLLAGHGLHVVETMHYGLFSPLIFAVLSMSERLAVRADLDLRWLTRPLWLLRRADARLHPGRLSYDVALRAVKAASVTDNGSGPS